MVKNWLPTLFAKMDAAKLVRRIDAAEASWDGSRWVFVSGFTRTFAAGREKDRKSVV